MRYLRFLGKRAQSTLEYAVILAVIVGALIVMQRYVRQGVQGRLKGSADDMGQQFIPGDTAYDLNTAYGGSSTESVLADGKIGTNWDGQSESTTGSETVRPSDEYGDWAD